MSTTAITLNVYDRAGEDAEVLNEISAIERVLGRRG